MKRLIVALTVVLALGFGCSEKENTSSNNTKAKAKNGQNTPTQNGSTPATSPAPTTPEATPAPTPEQVETAQEETEKAAEEISRAYTDVEALIEKSKTEPVVTFNGFGTATRPYDAKTETPSGVIPVPRVSTPPRHRCEQGCRSEETESAQRRRFSEEKLVPGHSREGFDHRGREIGVPSHEPRVAQPSTPIVIEPAVPTNVKGWYAPCRKSDWSFAQSKKLHILTYPDHVELYEQYYKVAGKEKQLSDSTAPVSCNDEDLIFTIRRTADNTGAQTIHRLRIGKRRLLNFTNARIEFHGGEASRLAAIVFANQIFGVKNYIRLLITRDHAPYSDPKSVVTAAADRAVQQCESIAMGIHSTVNREGWTYLNFPLSDCRYFKMMLYIQMSSTDSLLVSWSSPYELQTLGSVNPKVKFMDGRHSDQISSDMNYKYWYKLAR